MFVFFWNDVGLSVFVGNFSDDLAGIPDCDAMARDIFDHDAATSYDDVATDGDSGHDLDPSPNPDVIPYSNRIGILQSFVPSFVVNGVASGIKTAIWGNEDVVPEYHFGSIQNHKIMVRIEIFSNLDVMML